MSDAADCDLGPLDCLKREVSSESDLGPLDCLKREVSSESDLGPLDCLKREASEPLYAAGWTALHAAAVELDGRLIVMPGGSGAGKSTLALGLVGAGLRASDELVFLRRTEAGCIEAMVPRLPIAVTLWALERFPWAAGFRLRFGDDAGGKIAIDHPRLLETRGRPAAVVLLNGAEVEGTARRRLATGAEASCGLLSNLVRFPSGGDESRVARRRMWAIFEGLLAGPLFVLEGRCAADRFVAEVQVALKEVSK